MPQLPLFNIWFQGASGSLTTTDNAGNLAFKALITDRFDKDERAYVRSYDQQVPHGSVPTALAYGVLDAGVFNDPEDVHKSRKRTSLVTVQATLTDTYLGTAWEELKRFADRWTVTKINANSDVLPAQSLLQVLANKVARNTINWQYDLITVNAWETRTRREYDDELGLEVTIVESVVLASSSLTAPTATVWSEQRQVDSIRAIRTTYTLPLEYSKTHYETISYTFPAMLTKYTVPDTYDHALGLVFRSFFEEQQKRTVFLIDVNLREAFVAPVLARVVEEIITEAALTTLLSSINVAAYGTTLDLGTATTRARLFAARPRDINYSGFMFSLNVTNVLCEGQTITATTNSLDLYYGNSKVEQFTYLSSNIIPSAYVALADGIKEVCIEDFVKPWRHGLYWRRRVMIKLQ